MPRVNIVVPAYNAEAFIAETVRSALHQTMPDLQVTVINDGSRDATAANAELDDARVRVISQENRGMSRSRNRGMAEVDSEFVALLDADDLWHPEKLRLQLEALQARPDHDFCYTAFTVWQGEPRPDYFQEVRNGHVDEALSGWIYPRLILDNHALPSSVLWRRSAWDSMGGFLTDNQQTDDWEYLVRASTRHRFVRLAESFVLYRQHPVSLSRRIPATNTTELMRADLLRRFGMSSPPGHDVDPVALQRFQHRGWCNFADSHTAKGDLALGLKTFAGLLRSGPYRTHTLTKFAKSLFRRWVPND
ncbi:glycosyltransferase family 2 protein [Roseateles saccharophilus]|uniref:Glycosyltransferase involved in cell wall biosynthesis n=1 Tax=Roseateles saccharophilus TaxID=304 RepID=A0A4R3UIV9_ROSSA|nr:glycosyltransferase family 2 protein [Roseateles saccharophilus]MDG0835175.1 glycosyltransferase family 2 protein [Roseateles saccharophilus]TCU87816.1 glycosyltransferase involved in cell wall biosynthesis [Roseateles saccharophilus]